MLDNSVLTDFTLKSGSFSDNKKYALKVRTKFSSFQVGMSMLGAGMKAILQSLCFYLNSSWLAQQALEGKYLIAKLEFWLIKLEQAKKGLEKLDLWDATMSIPCNKRCKPQLKEDILYQPRIIE